MDVRLLCLPEQGVGGLSLGSVVSCCVAGVSSKADVKGQPSSQM